MRSFVGFFVFVWGIMGKCRLFLFMLKTILLWHKVGLCLHGHIFAPTFHYKYWDRIVVIWSVSKGKVFKEIAQELLCLSGPEAQLVGRRSQELLQNWWWRCDWQLGMPASVQFYLRVCVCVSFSKLTIHIGAYPVKHFLTEETSSLEILDILQNNTPLLQFVKLYADQPPDSCSSVMWW